MPTAVPQLTADTTELEAALAYAEAGFRVVPIGRGQKYPWISQWQDKATSDPATIRKWWESRPDSGVGLATGDDWWVLDIDNWEDWDSLGLDLPETHTVNTGGGGAHLYLRMPDDLEIRNNQSGKIAPGVDIRGGGGQVLAPPTVHPTTGVRYTQDRLSGLKLADCPHEILELVRNAEIENQAEAELPPSSRPTPAPAGPTSGTRPGDEWQDAIDWRDLLIPDGWTEMGPGTEGETLWCRPGKNPRDGQSATTGYKGGGLKVFTSSLTSWGLMADESYSKLGYLAETRFSGDYGEAARWLASEGFGSATPADGPQLADVFRKTLLAAPAPPALPETTGDEDAERTWDFVDLTDVLSGAWKPPVPTLVDRSDGVSMFYAQRIHTIAGEPGGGKTWLALAAMADRIRHGDTVMLIDYEDSPGSFVSRLRALGCTDTQIAAQAVYVRPDMPLTVRNGITLYGERTLQAIEARQPDFVAIDSTGEALSLEALDPNDDAAVAMWMRILPRRLAKAGATVLLLDHVTKAHETRGNWAIGSQRKLAAIDGIAYAAETPIAPTKEADGKVVLKVAKDRHGTHRRGYVAAEVWIRNATDPMRLGQVDVEWATPWTPAKNDHTVYHERITEYLAGVQEASGRQLEREVEGKGEHVRTAIGEMREAGTLKVRQRDGKGGGMVFSLPGAVPDAW